MDRKELTREAQRTLKKERPSLFVDGVWGPRTHVAYNTVTPPLRTQVAERLAESGTTADEMFRAAGYTPIDFTKLIEVEAVEALVVKICAEVNFSEYATCVNEILQHENKRIVRAGRGYYDPIAVNPLGYSGLAQAKSAFWEDARRVDPSIGPFATGWMDPAKAIRAIIAYQKKYLPELLETVQQRRPTCPLMYALHNQGPAGSARAITTGVLIGKQSARAQATINQARVEAGFA